MEESKVAEERLDDACSESERDLILEEIERRSVGLLADSKDFKMPYRPELDRLLVRVLNPIAKDVEKINELCRYFFDKYGESLLQIIMLRGMSVEFLGKDFFVTQAEPYEEDFFLYESLFITALKLDCSKEFLLSLDDIYPEIEIYYNPTRGKIKLKEGFYMCSRVMFHNVEIFNPETLKKLIKLMFKHTHAPIPNELETKFLSDLTPKLLDSPLHFRAFDDLVNAFDDYRKRTYGDAYDGKKESYKRLFSLLPDNLHIMFHYLDRSICRGMTTHEVEMLKICKSNILAKYLDPVFLSDIVCGITSADDLVDTMIDNQHMLMVDETHTMSHSFDKIFNARLPDILNYFLNNRDEKIVFARRIFDFEGEGNIHTRSHCLVRVLDNKSILAARYLDDSSIKFRVRLRSLEILRLLFPAEYLSEDLIAEIWPADDGRAARFFGLEIRASKFLNDLSILSEKSTALNYGLHRLKIAMKIFEFVSHPEHIDDNSIIKVVLLALSIHPRAYEFGVAIGSQPKLIDILNEDDDLRKVLKAFRAYAMVGINDPESKEKSALLMRMFREKDGSYNYFFRGAKYAFLERLAAYTGYSHGFLAHVPGVPIPQLERPVALDSEGGQAIVRMMQREIDRNLGNINLRAKCLRDREELARIRGQKHTRKQELLPEVAGTLKFMI